MDGWSECFDYNRWMDSFAECEIDHTFYLNFPYGKDDNLPWQHIHTGVSKDYLWSEYEKSIHGENTVDCRFEHCTQCDCCQTLNVAIQLLGADDK